MTNRFLFLPPPGRGAVYFVRDPTVGNVRFTPKSGHWNSVASCPLCAKSGHSALRKRTALFDHLVGGSKKSVRHGSLGTGLRHPFKFPLSLPGKRERASR